MIKWICKDLNANKLKNNFIPNAINKGSKIIVTEKKVKSIQNGILYIHTKNIRKLGWRPKYTIKESVIETLKFLIENKWILNKKNWILLYLELQDL